GATPPGSASLARETQRSAWVWVSIKPGARYRPLAFRVFLALISWALPTKLIRSPVMPTSSSTESFPEPSKTQAPWIKRSTSWGPSWATSDNGPQKRRGKSFIRYRYGAIIGYGLFLSIACGTVVPAAVPDGLNAARGYFDHLG